MTSHSNFQIIFADFVPGSGLLSYLAKSFFAVSAAGAKQGSYERPIVMTPLPAPTAQSASDRARDLIIRTAGPADLAAIDRIETRSFERDRFPRRNLRRVLASPAATFLLALSDGAPAGYLMLLYRRGSRVARLYSLAVDPGQRGRGVADALIGAALTAAVARGADRLRLELRPSNAGALRLYERAGFTVFERKPTYYDDGEDAIRMERSLTSPPAGGRSAL